MKRPPAASSRSTSAMRPDPAPNDGSGTASSMTRRRDSPPPRRGARAPDGASAAGALVSGTTAWRVANSSPLRPMTTDLKRSFMRPERFRRTVARRSTRTCPPLPTTRAHRSVVTNPNG